MSQTAISYSAQRLNMVDAQIRTNDVTDLSIQGAMLDIAREGFVPEAKRASAYADRCIEVSKGRYLLDPRSLAKLVQLAAVRSGDSVLDVGCASGYSTALLSRLAGRVVALEENAGLMNLARGAVNAGNVTFVEGPLSEGARQHGPFDVIFVNGAVETPPEALLDQLADGGRLVVVLKDGAAGHACLYMKHQGAISDRQAFDAEVPVLPGFEKRSGFVF